MNIWYLCVTEAVAQRCSVKKAFLEISQNSQKSTCARVSFFNNKNIFFYRTPPVAASGVKKFILEKEIVIASHIISEFKRINFYAPWNH